MTETPRRSYRRGFLLGMACVSVPVLGTVPVLGRSAEPNNEESVVDSFRALGEQVDGFDWDQEYPYMERALRNIWAQNGWNDEADRYAYELIREVAAIPPWQFAKRLDLFTDRLGERYGMNEHDEARLKGMILREVGGVLVRNTGVLFEQVREALGTRARGEPYTAEQIARWMKAGAPLQADARLAADRVIKQLEPMLKPEGRRILERDAMSYRKRVKRYDEMAARWARGEWQPSDWGLQDDPIQSGATRGAAVGRRPSANRPGADGQQPGKQIVRWKAHDPATWFAYLLDFKSRFKLDPGQATAAESIHAEVLARANDYIRAHAEQLRTVPPNDRPTHETYEPIRALFREMQERFDAVPTSGQRSESQS